MASNMSSGCLFSELPVLGSFFVFKRTAGFLLLFLQWYVDSFLTTIASSEAASAHGSKKYKGSTEEAQHKAAWERLLSMTAGEGHAT